MKRQNETALFTRDSKGMRLVFNRLACSTHLSQPHEIRTIGNAELLKAPRLIGLLCSRKFPGELIMPTLDIMKHLRDKQVTVISGFHSPLERECLKVLLRGSQPLIICHARGIDGLRLTGELQKNTTNGRILHLSICDERIRRPTNSTALQRNELVAALAPTLFIPYASAGSSTEQLAYRQAADSLLTVNHECNSNLLAYGARGE